jgi:hypothetical protein
MLHTRLDTTTKLFDKLEDSKGEDNARLLVALLDRHC